MLQKNTTPLRIGIVGGGFAGLTLARRLASYALPGVSISLISQGDSFVYYPRTPELFINPDDTLFSFSLSEFCKKKNIFFLQDSVQNIDAKEKSVQTEKNGVLFFDYLAIAPGSISQDFGIPGVVEYTKLLTSKKTVIEVRGAVDSFFTHTHLKKSMTITLIGGGPTGIESAYTLGTYIKRIQAKQDPLCTKKLTLVVVEAMPRILSIMSEKASLHAMRALASVGVIVRTGEQVKKIEGTAITFADESMESDIIIWSAGFKVSPLLAQIAGATYDPKGKVLVNEYLEISEHPNTFILGDSASVEKSGLAQTAIQHGTYLARLIQHRITGENSAPFQLSFKGVVIPLGPYSFYQTPKNTVLPGILARIIRWGIDTFFFVPYIGIQNICTLKKEHSAKTTLLDTNKKRETVYELPKETTSTKTKKPRTRRV